MADYYPLINRAVTGLERNNAQNRSALYERARVALVTQLRGIVPAIEEREITRERLALEEAIRRVEVNFKNINSEIVHRTESKRRQKEESSERKWLDQIDPNRELYALQQAMRLVPSDISDQFKPLIDEINRLIQISLAQSPSAEGLKLPSASSIPDQNRTSAVSFTENVEGLLDLSPDRPSKPNDKEQNLLYKRLRTEVEALKQRLPSQLILQISNEADDFLRQPDEWSNVEFKRVLFCSFDSLRVKLELHDEVKNDPEPNEYKLSPEVAAALRTPMSVWAIFIEGDEALAALEARRPRPPERRHVHQAVSAAKPLLVAAANDPTIVTPRAAEAILIVSKAPEEKTESDIIIRSQTMTNETSRNLVSQLLRRSYLATQRMLDPKTEQDNLLAGEFDKGLAKSAGELTAKGTAAIATAAAAATATAIASHSSPIIDFVVSNASAIKEFIAISFNNPHLLQIVDAISSIRKAKSQ